METVENIINGKQSGENLSDALKAITEFYEAFNRRDLEKMARNWSADGDVSMSNPLGGIKRGWHEIKTVYERIFNGTAEVYVEFYDFTIIETNEMFTAVGRERGTLKIDEIVINLAIRTTRIYVRKGVEWKQVHHHGSIEDADLLAVYQQAVKPKT